VLLAAGVRLVAVAPHHPRVVPTAERLNAIARDPRTKPAHAGTIASRLALTFGPVYLHMAVMARSPVDRATAAEVIELAELGFRLRPRDERARLALATARLLDHRPGDARDLLAGFSAARPETYALATGLFALAEIYLGNRERAEAIRASATGRSAPKAHHFAMAAMVAALTSAEPLPPLTKPDQSGGPEPTSEPDQGPDQASEGSQSPTAYLGSSEANPPASAASAASARAPASASSLASVDPIASRADDPAIAASSPEGSTPLRW